MNNQISTDVNLEHAKWIDDDIKKIVFGYIRSWERSLSNTYNAYYTIPGLVFQWCLLYYCHIESFSADYHESYFLESNNLFITKIRSDNDGIGFLTKKVSCNVHKWRFKLKQINGYSLVIGIWKATKPIDTSACLWTMGKNDKCYGVNITHGELIYGGRYGWQFGSRQSGDIVDMILDCNHFELSYCINNKYYGVAYKVEETSYKVMVAAYAKGDVIELLSYKQMKSNDNRDAK
eukprot:449992_1